MADLKAEMNKQIEKMVQSAKDGTIANAAKQYYTHDCKLMWPGMDKAVEGNDNPVMLQEFERRAQVNGKDVILQQDELLDLGDVAVDRGHYGHRQADGTITRKGLYVQVWKKVDGQWRVYLDIGTT